MPQFTPRPPVYEARQFLGGVASTLDIQGWLLGVNETPSEHVDSSGTEGEEGYIPEKIVVQNHNGAEDVVVVGQWLIFKEGFFSVITTSQLYKNYMQA